MEFREYLKGLLEDIALKQKERVLNETLARICKDLDSYSEKISDCLKRQVDLPQIDVDNIHALNDEYNAAMREFKQLLEERKK